MGTQGVPADIDPRVLRALQEAVDSQDVSAIQNIADEIAEAGGYDEWLEQQEDDDDSAEEEFNEESSIQQVLNEFREAGEEITKEQEETFRDIFKTIKDVVTGAIPTNKKDFEKLLTNVLNGVAGVSGECESWTERVPDGEGGTYQGWKDCVKIGTLLSIPGLDIPMPPGIVDITWKDLEDAVKETGQDIKDIISDPGGWLEDTAEKAKEKLIKARITMLLKYPFWGPLSARLVLEEAPWCQTIATDGRKFYYNSEFVLKLDDQECVFGFAHEVGHIIYEHMTRRGNRDPGLWNMAGDYIINNMLVRENVGKNNYYCSYTS